MYSQRIFAPEPFIELEVEFPRLFLNGFIVTWYSFIEQQLIELCHRRKLKIEISIQDRDNLDKGIQRAYTFLRKAADYQIEPDHWQELKIIGWLRNQIVHNDEWLPRSRKKPSGNKYTPVKEKYSLSLKEEDSLATEEETIYVLVDRNHYDYLKKHSLISEFDFRLTPKVEYCKYLVQFGRTFFNKIYKDLGAI